MASIAAAGKRLSESWSKTRLVEELCEPVAAHRFAAVSDR